MCSPTPEIYVSVHAIERFVQWRLRIPEGQIGFFNFFKSPEHVISVPHRIEMAAQCNYLRRFLELGRIDEALLAFDRMWEDTGILCLSTIGMLIVALCTAPDAIELSGEAELFLKSFCTKSPSLEETIRYRRYDTLIFVMNKNKVITCIHLRPDQRDVLDCIMFQKAIQPF
ncbi:MAG: hypothetical protein PHN19_00180 [Patescibacteria group bacterium]|nr:hypothetical protein [Patescibacteria group bacterium]